jgi:hypothetical protein
MSTSSAERTVYVPIDEREPSAVRCLILARTSNVGGTDDDVASQVDQCAAFIKTMGWHLLHPDDLYRYSEHTTGMRQVRRPVLRQVLQMAARHDVDVIVTLALARIDRQKARRYHAIQTALDYGVEFRFANRAETHGKLPDGAIGLLQELSDDLYDQKEAEKIVERLTPGRLKRYALGLPHGGRSGPNYGWRDGERKYKGAHEGRHGRPLGLLTWVVDEPKAEIVRRLFDAADQTDLGDLSLRGLARLLEDEWHAPTATGTGHWSGRQIWNILRNGKYAGVGRGLRYQVEWGKFTDGQSGEVYDSPRVRLRDAGETFPVSAEAIPPIITAEQWARVQVKLDALDAQHNRGGPRRTDAAAHSSLLDGGLVQCAHCHKVMTRFWHSGSPLLYYRCNKRGGTPLYDCKPHDIRADAVDALALRLLAVVLTDPAKIVELADAAEGQLARVATDAALTAAGLIAYQKRLDAIAADQEQLRTALKALGVVPGMETAVADTRARLEALDAEREDTEAERAALLPVRDHAHERAALLQRVAAAKGGMLDMLTACALLDIPNARAAVATLSGYTPEEAAFVQQLAAPGEYPTADVVLSLLKRVPRASVRKLLRDLGAIVLVRRPRTREEWARLGPTPVEERVALLVLDSVQVRADVANLRRFFTSASSTPARVIS